VKMGHREWLEHEESPAFPACTTHPCRTQRKVARSAPADLLELLDQAAHKVHKARRERQEMQVAPATTVPTDHQAPQVTLEKLARAARTGSPDHLALPVSPEPRDHPDHQAKADRLDLKEKMDLLATLAMRVQKDVLEDPVKLALKDQLARPEGMEHPDHRVLPVRTLRTARALSARLSRQKRLKRRSRSKSDTSSSKSKLFILLATVAVVIERKERRLTRH